MESIIIGVSAEVIVTLIVFAVGFFIGKYKEKKKGRGKNLDEYDFYPFEAGKDNFPEFDIKSFRLAVHYFLKNQDYQAARQLIFIGEQNNVRTILEQTEQRQYDHLYKKYDGDKIVDDNNEFLENYRKIVQSIGRTLPQMGIEVLLHNLMNPSKSIVEIENGDVTGRGTGLGTTMLVLDLKRRKILNEDKLNYELEIGSRKFKCTTIPIFRKDIGLVGAIGVNIDINYISDEVLKTQDNIQEFFKNYCQTDMKLDENILSKAEYEKALRGKRHWRQELT